jgi:hypothetical protein
MKPITIVLAFALGAASASAQTPPRAGQQVAAATPAARGQIVVLDDGDSGKYVVRWYTKSKSTPQTDAANAAQVCKDALGDRFGRMISFRKTNAEAEMFYFNRVVCETN